MDAKYKFLQICASTKGLSDYFSVCSLPIHLSLAFALAFDAELFLRKLLKCSFDLAEPSPANSRATSCVKFSETVHEDCGIKGCNSNFVRGI